MSSKYFVIFIIVCTILFSRFFFFFSSQKEYTDAESVAIETTLLSDVKTSGNLQRFVIREKQRKQPLFIVTSRFPEYSYGDTIKLSGRIRKKVIDKKKTIYSIYFPKITLSQPIHFLSQIAKVRSQVVRVFENTLPTDSASLLMGIVFGIKRPMSDSLRSSFESTGLLHVIAASGMNISMVGGFFTGLFSFFFNRRHALILTILGISYYAVISGLEPSILRASIMGTITYSALIIGRQSLSWYSLVITAAVILFISPLLFFDIGFQLSFLATAGLIFIRPLFELKRSFKNFLNKSVVGEGFVTTLSAQIATLPLLLLYFGSLSFVSILVNTLVLWTTPLLMILGGVGAILGLFFELGAKLLLFCAYPFLLYFQFVVKLFGTFGSIQVENLPLSMVIGYYFLLVAIVLYFYKRMH